MSAMVRGLASVLVLMVTTSVASAQPDPQGAKLFDEGRALAKAGKYAEACAKFSASLAIDPAIGTQLNYADCNEKLDHNADAWRLFDGAADAEKITNPERAKYARGRADALLPKLGVVIVKLATPDAPMLAVSIGGRTVKPAPVIKEIVDPGQVSITVTAKGTAPFQVNEKVSAGTTATIDVPAFAVETTSEDVTPPKPETPPRAKPGEIKDWRWRREQKRKAEQGETTPIDPQTLEPYVPESGEGETKGKKGKAKAQPKSEPPKSEPAKSEPPESEPAKSEPTKSEPPKTEPPKSETEPPPESKPGKQKDPG